LCFLRVFLTLKVRCLKRLIECNLVAALVEARRADEFDETLPFRCGALFESEDSAFVQARVVLTVMFHSNASKCELLENSYYHSEVISILCVALNVLPESQLSVECVVNVLAKSTRCTEIIVAVARNCPDRLDLVLKSLLGNGPALNRIAEQSPICVLRTRDFLMEAQMLPDLALHLTLFAVRDGLLFCAATLRSEASWIRLYFQQTQEKENTPAARMRGFLLHAVEEPEFLKSPRRLGQLLQLYNGLCGVWGLRLSSGSSQRIVTAIMNNAVQSRMVAEQGLCFLLVCEGLSKLLPPQMLSECLKVLLQSHAGPLVALAALRFAGKGQLALNAAWAKQTAGVPVSIHGESLQSMGAAWRDALPETLLASFAASMGPVPSLFAGMRVNEDGPALAMKEFMASHLLMRARVDQAVAANWMAKQIACLDLPLHSCVIELVAEFVNCCCYSGSSPLLPLSVDQVKALQTGSLVQRLVGAHLVLSHNSVVNHLGDKCRVLPYAIDVVEGFAVKRLLGQAAMDPRFGALPEKIMLLCLSDHPEMMADQKGFLLREKPLIAGWMLSQEGQKFWSVSAVHQELLMLSRRSDEQLCDEACQRTLYGILLPALLHSENRDESAELAFASIWHRVHNLMPVPVSVSTIEVLSRRGRESAPVTSAAMIKDPLLIISVLNPTVYLKFPAFLGLVLEILSVYASTSRKRILSAAAVFPEASPNRETLARLAIVQDTAISQLLIEIISVCESDSQVLVCAFLHQLWLEHPRVLALLHYQRYPSAVVPVLVEHVPSVHVVVDLLPVFLESAERRDWAVLVASFLLPKYATPKSLALARMIFQTLLKSAQTAPRQTLAFVKGNVTALRRLIHVFPVLLDEFVELCESVRGKSKDDQMVWDSIVTAFDITD
jgi:hypothetical protein